ncbi:MAG: Hypothetical protein BHV28_10270 [Candidatus Tokpelaia hoelldobleri]|uniref:Uncharacterized protein n=1 Tax=Candidatus Tokpelaia hoelldobleri TaxID=1902579 RepID=A0A1U9JV50_9HYPH|nr:MAG: Hypothetical protein BHV28_10270 [Candidatus Tokpelaia hoelldoblerii]
MKKLKYISVFMAFFSSTAYSQDLLSPLLDCRPGKHENYYAGRAYEKFRDDVHALAVTPENKTSQTIKYKEAYHENGLNIIGYTQIAEYLQNVDGTTFEYILLLDNSVEELNSYLMKEYKNGRFRNGRLDVYGTSFGIILEGAVPLHEMSEIELKNLQASKRALMTWSGNSLSEDGSRLSCIVFMKGNHKADIASVP